MFALYRIFHHSGVSRGHVIWRGQSRLSSSLVNKILAAGPVSDIHEIWLVDEHKKQIWALNNSGDFEPWAWQDPEFDEPIFPLERINIDQDAILG